MNLSIAPKHESEAIGDYAYRVLLRNITHVILKPGDCISPVEVAAELHMSRTPIQAAFSRLSGEGLIDIYPQRGSYVSMIDLVRTHESIYMRNILDQAAIRALCLRGPSEEVLTELSNLVDLLRFYHDKTMYAESFETDNKFHRNIYAAAGMDNINYALSQILHEQQRLRYLKLQANMRWEQTIDEHIDIISAIRARDAEKACYLSFLHISRFSLDIPAIYQVFPQYFINWESFSPDNFTPRSDVFYNLQQL